MGRLHTPRGPQACGFGYRSRGIRSRVKRDGCRDASRLDTLAPDLTATAPGKNGATVFDDGVVDAMLGTASTGSNIDWFFGTTSEDEDLETTLKVVVT
jgi:hypothetical protein